MPKFDFREIIKRTYKTKSEKRKDLEYCECFKARHNLDQQVSFEESRDDNTANKDYKKLKDILSILTSIIAIIAALSAGFSSLTNAMYSINAGIFYKISAELLYYNRNFDFILSLAVFAFTLFVFLSPIFLKDKWKNKKIDRVDAFLLSVLISFYLLIIFMIIFADFIVKISAKQSTLSIDLIMLVVFLLFRWFIYFLISGTFKFWVKKNEKSDTNKEGQKIKSADNLTIRDKIFYGLYIILFIAVILAFCTVIEGPDINPKDKMSYEIIKNEKDYNVIIGYKDGRAITLTGVESFVDGKISLNFISNEYMLQDVKDKVIIYKTFNKVIPYKFPKPISGSNGYEGKAVD